LHGVQEVGGSNPLAPTRESHGSGISLFNEPYHKKKNISKMVGGFPSRD